VLVPQGNRGKWIMLRRNPAGMLEPYAQLRYPDWTITRAAEDADGNIFCCGMETAAMFDKTGRTIWLRQVPECRTERGVFPLGSGSVLMQFGGSAYYFEPDGNCRWRTGTQIDLLVPPNPFVVAKQGLVVADKTALHFIKTDGSKAAAPIALSGSEAGRQIDLSDTVINESGWVFVVIRSTVLPPVKALVCAISPQGQPQWKIEVPPDFRLIYAATQGLVYGEINSKTISAFSHEGTTESEIICIEVVQEAAPSQK
jgi:hypothetical protein